MKYFPKYFSNKSIFWFFVIQAICIFVFITSSLPIQWLIISIITVSAFFYFLNKLTKSWLKYPNNIFDKKLFKVSLIIRLIAVLFIYIFFELLLGHPFEFKAADSMFYHEWGIKLSDEYLSGRFNFWEQLSDIAYSDRGYPLFLSLINIIGFQSIIFPRIINAFLGAYTCVLIYNLAKRNFDEKTARIAAIITMLLPNLIYYTGLHLKETLLVFIIVAFIDRVDYMVRSSRFNLKNIIIISSLGISLFLFRTVLGGAAFATLFATFAFSSSRISKWYKRIFAGIAIALLVVTFLSEKILQEIEQYWQEKDMNLTNQMQDFSSNQAANELAEYGSTIIFAPIILFAPFPTLVNVEGQENQMMLAGAYYTRNIYAFFVLIALLSIIKQRIIRHHILIIFIILSYLAVLANSGFALSERFHLPILPFLAILAAYGITKINTKNKRYFIPYLIIISIIIIGWNMFKLAGRGLV